MKPYRKKLQKCRDPDRVDLVALQRARREQGLNKEGKAGGKEEGDMFGGDIKRRKVDKVDDPFGAPL